MNNSSNSGDLNVATAQTETNISNIENPKSLRPQRTKSIRKIKISSTEERGAKLTKYHVYIIEIEPQLPGVLSVARRYNDFKWLRSVLLSQFPGVFVPPLPPAKAFGKLDTDFVQERRIDLERFLNRIEQIKPFSESLSFEMFLSRPEVTFSEGKKEIEEIIHSASAECMNKLKNLYPDICEQEHSEQICNDKIIKLREYLTKIEAQMKALDTYGTKLFENLNSICDEINIFNDSLNNLYTSENEYPYKSSERVDIRKQCDQWKTYNNKVTNEYYQHILKALKYEHQDIQAFLELFIQRDNIINRYNKSKSKVEKWKQKTNDNAELKENDEQQKQKDINEEKELQEFISVISKIILKNEIFILWSTKTEQWKQQIYEFANIQTELTNKMLLSWKSV